MLRGLFEEIVRRRLWPIALLALVVVAAAPLFFLRSAAQDEPSPAEAAQAARALPAAGDLPARAQRLLTTTGPKSPRGRRTGKGQDPFQAPAASARSDAREDATAGRSPSTAAGGGGPANPVPVVITDANGKKVQPTTGSDATPGGSGTTPAAGVAVDVRFSKHGTRHVMRSIPPMKPFSVAGKLIASFVRYSPTRKAAVFAVSPGTSVDGVACRHEDGTCRYVDISAGKHARLTLVTTQGQLITRRIDVVRITLTPAGTAPQKSAVDGACLLKKLLKLGLGDPPVKSDACA